MIKILENTKSLEDNIKNSLVNLIVSTTDKNNVVKKTHNKIESMNYKIGKINLSEKTYNSKLKSLKKMIDGLESDIASKIKVIQHKL